MTNFDLAVPVLSRGKHRNPRKGACFMEFASYLAGEPWSDHPACTHPLLAGVARDVNDCTTDAGRSRLAPLIPSVIGLTPDDPHVVPRVTVRCIQHALPVVSQERQYILAVALIVAERQLALLDGRPEDSIEPQSQEALDAVPAATKWARAFTAKPHRGTPDFARRTAPRAVSCAVEGISQACVPDPDERLYHLLHDAIEECRRWVPAKPAPSRRQRPAGESVEVG
ncbi:hypothetical protein Kfla_3734 [Kribbella flavida DSM 17836]|uniref:Uncharacterized protein n=1 Tax=Kribbella flavida (strain DSM 17836 / JCM 10339 / NBRC 14399) TaxID=479435 RepID=D2PNX1_KRIFD|nr:hypothetical protein [Kribbella flavida]ADB32789.1 hypothetical protein Kfla_3734 [Kribbella flavida DSM 17836]